MLINGDLSNRIQESEFILNSALLNKLTLIIFGQIPITDGWGIPIKIIDFDIFLTRIS